MRGDGDSAPVVPAFATGDKQWAMVCVFCRRWHFHGAGAGHRAAHCHIDSSPYCKRGYILEYAGKLTAEIRKNGGK